MMVMGIRLLDAKKKQHHLDGHGNFPEDRRRTEDYLRWSWKCDRTKGKTEAYFWLSP